MSQTAVYSSLGFGTLRKCMLKIFFIIARSLQIYRNNVICDDYLRNI